MTTGEIEYKTWKRRPELTTIETKQHETVPGLSFEIGIDASGKADLKSVTYPDSYTPEQIKKSVSNREKILQTEGCKHCKKINSPKSRFPILKRFRDALASH